MPFLGELSTAEIDDLVRRLGGKRYNTRQILDAYHQGAGAFQDVTPLPVTLRSVLADQVTFTSLEHVRTAGSPTEAQKFLFRLHDRRSVESVLIYEAPRITACLSTQVGCPAECVFCASGLGGLVRNLSPAEILDQFLHLKRTLPKGQKITNVVIMGMGEPFLNYANTLSALRRLNAADGCGVAARRITVSTVGIPKRIEDFAAEGLQVNLAISLHAPNDEIRKRVVPLNRDRGIGPILTAARKYFEITGREVTFEYVLLDGINDAAAAAEELANRLKGIRCSVNLIPFNPVEGLAYAEPPAERCRRFEQILLARGVTATIRKRKGSRDAAACGQLRLIEKSAQ